MYFYILYLKAVCVYEVVGVAVLVCYYLTLTFRKCGSTINVCGKSVCVCMCDGHVFTFVCVLRTVLVEVTFANAQL